MCSCTPKISCTTRTSGNFLSFASGIARYAGIAPILISPATRPVASVVIVCAPAGLTASAKPLVSEVTRKALRSISISGSFCGRVRDAAEEENAPALRIADEEEERPVEPELRDRAHHEARRAHHDARCGG